MLRPWIDIQREAILAEAHFCQLQWIEDESNQSEQFDRNFIRHRVTPLLQQRWPAFSRSIAQFADHCEALGRLSEECAVDDWSNLRIKSGAPLPLKPMDELSPVRRSNLVRYWLKNETGQLVGLRVMRAVTEQLLTAREDRNPSIQWENHLIKRYNHHLYLQDLRELNGRESQLEELGGLDVLYWDPRESASIYWKGQCLTLAHQPPGQRIALDQLMMPLQIRSPPCRERICKGIIS